MRAHLSRLVCGLAALGLGLIAAPPVSAAGNGQVPAWLDDAISSRNKANPDNPITFVAIRDSYVWYSMSNTPATDSKQIRQRVYAIARENKYQDTQDEEVVTTASVPVDSGHAKQRKCYTRSFLRDVQHASDTTVQRMLTTMVCEADGTWNAGFRIAQ
jgi:hypothetical protein